MTPLLIAVVGFLTVCPVVMLLLGSFSKGLGAFGAFTVEKYVQAYTDPSFADILVRTDDQIRFTVLLYEKGVEKERWPRAGQISFAVPDEDFQSLMWQL